MRHSEKDNETFVRFSWFWTPLAVVATVLLVILAALAVPLVFVVAQLSLPRPIKPLRGA